jgi:ABC-type phosphate transport system substrate-binding protein
MKDFGQRLSDWYAKKSRGVRFEIRAGDPHSSFAAMAASNAEIVESSRHVLHSEEEALRSARGKSYLELQIATEIAGLTVNVQNPVKEISLYDLRQILSGGIKNWKQVGGHDAPINIYGRDSTSGVGSFLEEEFMGDLGISSHAKTFATNSAVFGAVDHDVNGIGYGTVDPRMGPYVRFLAIKASASGQSSAAYYRRRSGQTIQTGSASLFLFCGDADGRSAAVRAMGSFARRAVGSGSGRLLPAELSKARRRKRNFGSPISQPLAIWACALSCHVEVLSRGENVQRSIDASTGARVTIFLFFRDNSSELWRVHDGKGRP